MNEYIRAWKQMFNYSGRDTRKQYWMFVLINFIVSIILEIVDPNGAIYFLYSVVVILPSLSIGARRLHDINKSGWWQLLAVIPVIGWIILIVWTATNSQPETNRFGPNPKGGQSAPTPQVS